MLIMNKIKEKATHNYDKPGVTIAFFGDSVTQGCFEVYQTAPDTLETVFDKNNAYHAHLAKIFSIVYPTVPVNMINSGIAGDNACHAVDRLERDVLSCNPDLVVVCFGLNDSGKGKEGLSDYAEALSKIFHKLQESGKEVVFMTPNMMNTSVSVHIKDEYVKNVAENKMKVQIDGVLDLYIEKAKEVCKSHGVKVCDCYAKWKLLEENGANITELLANKINHPTREMNWLFAISLFETMLS